MNASRSRRDLTSETSISDTSAEGDLRRSLRCHRGFLQRFGHVFLTENQVNKKQIKHGEFEPEVPNRLTDKQESEQHQHPRVCHQ